jgi:hypothetical protein
MADFFKEFFRSLLTATLSHGDIYREFLAPLNARRCLLLDHPRLITQLCGLERRTARGGRDSIDHAPLAHGDCANSAAGVLVLVGAGRQPMRISPEVLAAVSRPDPGTPARRRRFG